MEAPAVTLTTPFLAASLLPHACTSPPHTHTTTHLAPRATRTPPSLFVCSVGTTVLWCHHCAGNSQPVLAVVVLAQQASLLLLSAPAGGAAHDAAAAWAADADGRVWI
eukprot:60450-Chlamydomonas_euryale.AAC.1